MENDSLMRFIGPEKFNRKSMKNGRILSKLKCWGESCKEPLIVHGYPWYLCENHHSYNDETEECCFWIPTAIIYHPLLDLMDRNIKRYQNQFFPKSRSPKQKESTRIYIDLAEIGKILYEFLEISEPDTFHWYKESYRGHAGKKFASNTMSKSINDNTPVIIEEYRWVLNLSAKGSYAVNAKNFIREHSPLYLKILLLNVITDFNHKHYSEYLRRVITKNSEIDDGIPDFELDLWKKELSKLNKLYRFRNRRHTL